MKNIKIILIAISLIFVSGCVQTKHLGDDRVKNKFNLEKIKKGVTTKKQMDKWFGEGDWVVRDSKKLYLYTFIDMNIFVFSVSSTTYQIQVYYNNNNVVKRFDYVVGNKAY